jgi:hypothetical protein
MSKRFAEKETISDRYVPNIVDVYVLGEFLCTVSVSE